VQYAQKRKKVGWVCTYTPEELIYAAGFTPTRLFPGDDQNAGGIEDIFPNSICPFVRQVMNEIRNEAENLEGLVIANSCNAMMHLYNALNKEFNGFVYLLDVPRKIDLKAENYFYRELHGLLYFLEKQGGRVNDRTLKNSIELYNHRTGILKKLTNGNGLAGNHFKGGVHEIALEAASISPEEFISRSNAALKKAGSTESQRNNKHGSLLLSGSILPAGLVEMLESISEFEILPDTCSGLRYILKPGIEIGDNNRASRDQILQSIACSYLSKPPCPRQLESGLRKEYFLNLLEEFDVKALVYHDLMFCDLCHYDYLMIKEWLESIDLPHLKIKTELGREDSGQLQTRVEAFLEII